LFTCRASRQGPHLAPAEQILHLKPHPANPVFEHVIPYFLLGSIVGGAGAIELRKATLAMVAALKTD
jgi:hypothetical protein